PAATSTRTLGQTPATATAASASAPRPVRERAVGSIAAAVIWFLALEIVGIAALGLVYVLFPYLSDRGAGFAKVFGLAGSVFISSLLVKYRVFHQGSRVAWVSLAAVAAASLVCLGVRGREMRSFWRGRRHALVWGEAVFAFGFIFFLGLRSFNPEISWG